MTVEITRRDAICIVAIDRPERRNAVDAATAQALADAFRAFDEDDGLSVAILTGRVVGAEEALAIGLANRLAEPGQALDAALLLASEIAQFPQICLRHDRLSALEQWDLDWDAAMRNEFRHGRASLDAGESRAGAERFSQGAGRHGTFK